MRLTGRTAIVTGGARGIGQAVALALASEGASVMVADQNGQGASQVMAEINRFGGKAQALAVDVADPSDVENLVGQTLAHFGSLDILVNNAGIIRRVAFTELTRDEWDLVLDVNLGGTFNCCKAVVPIMMAKRYGKIVNMSSIVGLTGDKTASAAYTTSKGAIISLTKALARQLAEYNINVNAIAPHAIESEMIAEWTAEKKQRVIESIPLRRIGLPEDVAEAAIFLASDGASFITGETINVNGGYLMD
jgi:3-oxoacyl-[acyl-carrier protein] reductase